MPLIHCPDCNQQISDRAESCIHCGAPLREQPPRARQTGPEPHTVTTEATGKQWKAFQLIGVLFIAIGAVACSASDAPGGGPGALIFNTLGLIALITGGAGAWWNHR